MEDERYLSLLRRIQHKASDKVSYFGTTSTPKGEPNRKKIFILSTERRGHWEGCNGITLKASVISAFASQAPRPALLISFIAPSTVL